MDNHQLSLLLKRYLLDECSDEEIAIIEHWYEKYESVTPVIDQMSEKEIGLLKSRMLAAISEKVDAFDSIPEETTTSVKIVSIYKKWWFRAISAAVILMILKISVFDGLLEKKKEQPDNRQVFVVNNTRKVLKKILSDGSVVWLKPNSKIGFPIKFAKNIRLISMDGECFFEISKNPERPFIIKSSHLITKVWGTSFKVKDYHSHTDAMVKVLTGKVSVVKNNKVSEPDKFKAVGEIMLTANQKVSYQQKDDRISTIKMADMQDMSEWKHLSLSFENEPLSEVVKKLKQSFNVDIVFENTSLENMHITADLTKLNLAEVLEVLKASMNIDYEISESKVSLIKSNKF
ncbi:hypothetical protein ASU31_00775 [Pedobacter ginsenosidimutans]|uniref:FecR family protein n=1 Tax=Pedobacter ginsenosidimutans TaxID=687842 RepID=A0A0T5VVH7_9SPHI|nr:FecR family protein [Pedobacter ginsenosidimutans]KRT17859.1 hypothetical protein ASU31_00775 [Pedobacter ginsenosidimutans]